MSETSGRRELLLLCLVADFHLLERQQSGPTAHTAGGETAAERGGVCKTPNASHSSRIFSFGFFCSSASFVSGDEAVRGPRGWKCLGGIWTPLVCFQPALGVSAPEAAGWERSCLVRLVVPLGLVIYL